MVRVSTIPNRLTKEELFNVFKNTLESTNTNVFLKGSANTYPIELVTSNDTTEEIVLYISNISHGGKTRNINEYRIQIAGTPPLRISDKFKTLLLGWYDELKVFAAFDARHHQNFGRSPSIQVTKEKLQEGHDKGIAFQIKRTSKTSTGEDTVIVFSPNYIINYIEELYPRYHIHTGQGLSKGEEKLLDNKPLDAEITEKDLEKLSKPRRMAIIILNKKLRESKFREAIFQIYKGKCAICNLQLRLTEAAHIIGVGEMGSDEITNGVLLCRNHHKAYDAGILAINEEYKIVYNVNILSKLKTIGLGGESDKFLKEARIGEKINLPDDKKFCPNKDYLKENCKLKGII